MKPPPLRSGSLRSGPALSGWLAALALPVLLLAAMPVAAQTPHAIPVTLRGNWFAGSCEAPEAMLALTARSAARIGKGSSRLDRFTALRDIPGWLLGTSEGVEAPRLLLRARDAGLETAEPEAKTLDAGLPGDVPVTAWRRCDPPPLAWMLRHGEGAAVLGAVERMEAGCVPGTTALACTEAVVAAADVSGDRLLGPAEIARIARGLGWMIAVRAGTAGDDDLISVGGPLLGGLAAARVMLGSLDYDGDGRLSARELAQDRGTLSPSPAAGAGPGVLPGAAVGSPAGSPALGAAAGRPLKLDGLEQGAGLLRDLLDGLLGGG
ncbi:hypothetical protein RQ831_16370 [Roseomonas gilardii]|uniref:EF-hand domain-containing protein n=1 Tax=Roseomonas gilardii TaxID=257708 RepID=A0ABU3MI19_9PROT|nr:hypothetical protein [Roseomonas gilardii]MDT8332634.1 hypothetical protein [Roseomonas gilardii]